jgi:hypothetical protein
MFKAMVHNNETLTGIQKFHYLKSSLTGEAEEFVSSLAMTSSNYTIAWQRMIERYDNKRLIATCHVRHILELKQMNKESANEIVELVNSSNNINTLEALKINTLLSDVIISQVVTQKLEPEVGRHGNLKLNDTPFPPLSEFISFL